MIVKNDNLDIPHGNTVIWRYVGLDKFLDLLMSQELFFTNAAHMSDKYEGLIPKRNQEYLFKSIKTDGVEMVMPGDNLTIHVDLIQPIALNVGLRFAIREGGRTVGAGLVTEILD